MSAITRFLGDSPLRVALKLVVVSFLVGLVMSAFGWTLPRARSLLRLFPARRGRGHPCIHRVAPSELSPRLGSGDIPVRLADLTLNRPPAAVQERSNWISL
jgi:hypothetical protein